MTVGDDTIDKLNTCASVWQSCLDTLCCSNRVAYCGRARLCVQCHVHNRTRVTVVTASRHATPAAAEPRETPCKQHVAILESSPSNRWRRWDLKVFERRNQRLAKWSAGDGVNVWLCTSSSLGHGALSAHVGRGNRRTWHAGLMKRFPCARGSNSKTCQDRNVWFWPPLLEKGEFSYVPKVSKQRVSHRPNWLMTAEVGNQLGKSLIIPPDSRKMNNPTCMIEMWATISINHSTKRKD